MNNDNKLVKNNKLVNKKIVLHDHDRILEMKWWRWMSILRINLKENRPMSSEMQIPHAI
jgi:hypothetical protein